MEPIRVTDDTADKIVLTMTKPEQEGKGCSGVAIGATIVLILIVSSTGLVNLNNHRFWLFWVVLIVAVLIEIFVVYMAVLMSPKNHIREATVEIDGNSQSVLRLERLSSGKTKQRKMKFAEITHILIHGKDLSHHFYVTLSFESKNGRALPIDTLGVGSWPYNPIIELGKKLGQFVKRPVIVKVTDLDEPVSEEIIQE